MVKRMFGVCDGYAAMYCRASDVATLEAELALLKEVERARLCAIIHTIGGTVEGHPTCELDYLQRLRELVEEERLLGVTRKAKAENDERYMIERDEARAELAEANKRLARLRGLALDWMSSARAARHAIFGPNDKVDYDKGESEILAAAKGGTP